MPLQTRRKGARNGNRRRPFLYQTCKDKHEKSKETQSEEIGCEGEIVVEELPHDEAADHFNAADPNEHCRGRADQVVAQ